jgi:hypothetical protein
MHSCTFDDDNDQFASMPVTVHGAQNNVKSEERPTNLDRLKKPDQGNTAGFCERTVVLSHTLLDDRK